MKRELTISCSKSNLTKIRNFVNEVLVDLHIHEMEVHKMVLAVDEVCANLIIHSNNCNPDHKIDILIDLPGQQEIIFTIKDQGLSFNYNSYIEPEISEIVSSRKKGGVGLMLVKRIMDKVEFSKDKNYNICRLTKKIDS